MNTYQFSRIEPLVQDQDGLTSVVTSLVVGMSATNGEQSAYIDIAHPLPEPDPDNFIPFDELPKEWAMDIAEAVAEEQGFKAALDQQLEAQAAQPVSAAFGWQTEPATPDDS